MKVLFLLDATVFGFYKAILKTTGRCAANGKKNGWIKSHTVFEATSLTPSFVHFDAAVISDQNIYKTLRIPQGSFVVFGGGYNNYRQFAAFSHSGHFFITRQKDNAFFSDVVEC